jgi:hypothetical protein
MAASIFCDSFISIMPWAIVCTTSTCRSLICVRAAQNFSKFSLLASAFSNSSTSSKLFAYHVLTRFTLGVLSKLSGSKAISFIMFANRTGNSFLKKMNDLRSHAFIPKVKFEKNIFNVTKKFIFFSISKCGN